MSVRTSLGLAGSQAARAHFLGSTRHWFCKGLYVSQVNLAKGLEMELKI
jgi:hypothetical protein